MKQRALINIIAYSIGGASFLNSFEVYKERKIGLYLKDILSCLIDYIRHKHIMQLIIGNTSNYESDWDMLMVNILIYTRLVMMHMEFNYF